MVYCIYDTVFYGFIGYKFSSYIFWKLFGARDAQTQHFTNHHDNITMKNVEKL